MWLIAATISTQVLQFVTMWLLARWYTPADIGLLSQFSAYVLLFVPWAAACFPSAFALAAATDRTSLFQLSTLAILCSALAGSLLLPLLHAQLWQAMALPTVMLLISVFAAIVAACLFAALQQWNYSQQHFVVVAKIMLVSAMLLAAGRILLGMQDAAITLLIGLTLAVPGFSLLMLAVCTGFPQWRQRLDQGLIRRLLHQYREFPRYQMPQQMLNAFSQNLPLLMLGIWYSATDAGFYGLALACLGAPALLVNRSVGDVIFPRFARLKDQPTQLSALFMRSSLLLLALSTLPFLLFLSAGPELFSWIFGSTWWQAGQFAQLLAPWFWLVGVNAPALKLLVVLRQQKRTLQLNVLTFVLRTMAVYLCGTADIDVLTTIKLLSAIGIFHNLVVLALAFYSVKAQCRRVTEDICR